MVPLIGTPQEFRSQRLVIDRTAQQVFDDPIDYTVGTMIERPRATLMADQIAKEAEFFSFGTNDLTQMTFGYSRNDAGKFLWEYLKEGLLDEDPFQVLGIKGVGQLIEMTIRQWRSQKRELKIGIRVEHGGEPKSVAFCYQQKFDCVSCSPYRVLETRLAAEQTALVHWAELAIV